MEVEDEGVEERKKGDNFEFVDWVYYHPNASIISHPVSFFDTIVRGLGVEGENKRRGQLKRWIVKEYEVRMRCYQSTHLLHITIFL